MFKKLVQKAVMFMANRLVNRLEKRFGLSNIYAYIDGENLILLCDKDLDKSVVTGIPYEIFGYKVKIKWQ